jgi:predicted ATP-binding protein involved in virulence
MKKIIFNNYRCFEHLELDFNSGINLFFGDNASGKTTIIRALQAALSSFFAGFSDENTRFIGLKKQDFSQILVSDNLSSYKPISLEFLFDDFVEYPELLNFHTWLEKTNSIDLINPKGRTRITGLKELKTYTKRLQDSMFFMGSEPKQLKSLPLFACFTTEDIHSKRKINAKKFKSYFHKPSFGYYECLEGSGFFPYWIKRLIVLEEGQKSMSEVEAVRNAIIKALGVDGCNIISDMIVRPKQGKVYYIFTDGREVEADNLSDGYARLVNIVTDIAFRCMLLNKGIYGLEACKKTIGTVLIDEIDLHLHPSLQAKVLHSLQLTFPKLQFIVSTHAPMVMSGIKPTNENLVFKLNYSMQGGYQIKSMQTYGLDASTILDVVLDVTPRSKDVDDKLNTLFNLIDIDDYPNASKMLNEMREEFGDRLPDLAKAQAMLNFLTDDND